MRFNKITVDYTEHLNWYFCCILSLQVAVLLMQYFSGFRTTKCKVAYSQEFSFDDNSIKSRSLQIKLVPKLISNVLENEG